MPSSPSFPTSSSADHTPPTDEGPGLSRAFTLVYRIVEAAGLRSPRLSADAGGAAIDELGGTDAVLLTPVHQFPMGAPLEPQRRLRVVRRAVDSGAIIIEDDYDGEFRYDRQAIGAMQALASEHVVYAGTASKSLVPGLRLAWLVLPGRLVDDVVGAKEARGMLTSSLDQLTLSEFIASGAYDRQVRRARLAYRRRRDRLVATLRQRAPHVEVAGIAAGLHALVRLGPGANEDDVVASALQHGLASQGLRAFCADGHHQGPALVVGYATPPGHLFTAALARLCAVLSDTAAVQRARPDR